MQERFDDRLRHIPGSALHGLVARIAQVEAFRGWWDGIRKPSGAIMDRRLEAVAAESAGESARLAGLPPSPADSGYAETLRAVFTGHAEMAPDERRILALHAGIFRTRAADRLRAGRYKTAGAPGAAERRWFTDPVALRAPGPLLIPAQMEALSAWYAARSRDGEFHPVVVAAAYLLEFLAIRPFADGNGRLGRLLTNLLLLRCGHAYIPYGSLEKAIAGDWAEYYLALRRSQASRNLQRPDISPWLLAFLDALRVQQRMAHDAVSGVPAEGRLSGNQAAVLGIAARRGVVTNRMAAGELGLSRETVKQTLNRLTALGALQRLGAGRATRYCLPGARSYRPSPGGAR